MQPNDRRAAPAALRTFIALAALASPLDAHSLLRCQGQAVVESNRVVVTFDVSPEDFTHLYGLVPSADGTVSLESVLGAARNHADDLTASFELWDERGERLVGEPFRLDPLQLTTRSIPWMQLRAMRVRYTASYALRTHRLFLTFRMNPSDQGLELARQWVIDVRGSDDAAPRTLQLTSRGNTETVEVQWNDDRPRFRPHVSVPNEAAACAPFEDRGTARFHEVFVDFEMTPEAISVRMNVPLPLLDSWIPLRRRVEGRLESDEQAALLAAAPALMRTALTVACGGEPLTPDPFDLRILRADAQESEDTVHSEPLGFFSSRLEVSQRFGTPSPAERWNAVWRLLNGKVLGARVAIHANGQCMPREFSSYTPTLEWRRNHAAALSPR